MQLFCCTMGYIAHQASVHGIFQAGVMEWVAISFPEHRPDPGIKLLSPALAGGFFTAEPPGLVKNFIQIFP